MTPAVNIAKKAKIPYTLHSYAHDPASASYGEEASEKLGISADRVYKTLVTQIDSRELVVAVIPVSAMLSMKHIAKAAGGKKAQMAVGADVLLIGCFRDHDVDQYALCPTASSI